MRLALIVEGPGDAAAIPCLMAKTAIMVGDNIYAAPPITSGGIHKLRRAGHLEKMVLLADSRDVDAILLIVDVDDDCPVQVSKEFHGRIETIKDRVRSELRIALCVREYECWFLEGIENLRISAPDYGWDVNFVCNNPEQKRDAKGLINEAMSKHYKATTDQLILTQRLDLKSLYEKSRSYKRFVRAVTGADYDILDATIL
ncbi:DUF4276 family protein [Phenylobacterium sp. LjRoot225]|uniref:DUF4276 family protein n=1 Tax=Phenylobacterium sp. LjRoot225 TaxID=3342285 RepID=UPI003ECCFCBE